MADAEQNFVIQQGKTWHEQFRLESEEIVYKEITAISRTAPVVITAVGHGALPGWRAAVTNALGMAEINAQANNVLDDDYHLVTVIDDDNVSFNDVNAAGFHAYTSGGYLQYNAPLDLTGFTARMHMVDSNGNVLVVLTTENGGITIDQATRTITLYLDDEATAAIAWRKAYYDLELISPSGIVTSPFGGVVTVAKERTI